MLLSQLAVITVLLLLFSAAVAARFLDASARAYGAMVNAPLPSGPATGPLKIHPSNPRYFTDGSGKAIYLTGSHTWNNFQERYEPYEKESIASKSFDYVGYLDFLNNYNHNFMRMWVWEQSAWAPWSTDKIEFEPLPYRQTGASLALNGGQKFDLNEFNQAYFDRLRSRVLAARDRGIYVAVMLFQGFSIDKKATLVGNPWLGHPFHKNNNINGIDGDLNENGQGEESHTLQVPAITALQEAYVRKVIDTLNDLDNVLWEISNESHDQSTDWQYHMINYIKDYEAHKSKQHPVGMTVEWVGGSNSELFAGPADWISPNHEGGYRDNPPTANGSKVIISDTDHLWGVGGNEVWVWKSFCRGLNPIYMDPLDSDPANEAVRKAMGDTLRYAERMNLAAMTPREDCASTGYCLVNPGEEYLVYLPFDSHWTASWIKTIAQWMASTRFLWRFAPLFKSLPQQLSGLFRLTTTVDLSAALGKLSVEWFNPQTSETMTAGTTIGGVSRDFTAPFRGNAVLYLASTK